ncbi:hypothetical protein M407DRAFT_9839 [Tulasnella calospora MUT 4182]|uniref:Uncharacterized protein n=1 Tax=Tulasnella calospora MUT 4182 TaxID=1051891 RepID=A0A0C3KMQ9_9AGAM|nr:hypothetical protein M407DRAFT_9839 [Tulasnella calospora MUT 4182]
MAMVHESSPLRKAPIKMETQEEKRAREEKERKLKEEAESKKKKELEYKLKTEKQERERKEREGASKEEGLRKEPEEATRLTAEAKAKEETEAKEREEKEKEKLQVPSLSCTTSASNRILSQAFSVKDGVSVPSGNTPSTSPGHCKDQVEPALGPMRLIHLDLTNSSHP